jgi:hypothetical protein
MLTFCCVSFLIFCLNYQAFSSRIDGWPPEADRGLFFKLTSDVSIRAPKMKGQSLGLLYVGTFFVLKIYAS